MKKIVNILAVLVGNTIFAYSVAAFIEPTGIISGGTTGVGLFAQNYFGVPVSVTFALINIVCFALGFFLLGKSFAFTTLISTLYFPVILHFFEGHISLIQMTDNLVLCSVFSGLMTGLGVGMVIRFQSSTGGLDIPLILLNKYWGISIAASMLAENVIVLLLQFPFSSAEQVLYGIIQTVVVSLVIDRVVTWGNSQIKLLVISPFFEEIGMMLLTNQIGMTFIPIETGYERKEQKAILCAMHPRRFPKIQENIRGIDSMAFIMVERSTEIWGRGFTVPR